MSGEGTLCEGGLRQALLVTDTLEIPIILVRKQQTIEFVRDHLDDLRAVLLGAQEVVAP